MGMMSDAATTRITITSLTDGPLEVIGEVEIRAADGTLVKEAEKAYLCRCGHSAKKPFCDGSHKKQGFTAP
jgi:CDGSH-type Zn-finger protein